MRALGSLWSWAAIVLVILVGFAIQAVLALAAAPFDRRRIVAGRFFRLMGVAAAWLIPSWSFGVHGAAPRRVGRKTVVVSNHASNADPFLISHLPWEMKWLGKSSLFKIPFLGWSMWLAGDVQVTRGEKDSVGRAMAVCARWLDRGVPIMIFPEGTRSASGELGTFKDGAFRLALETGADVLPIAVTGTHTALPKHSWLFGRSFARVAVGTPIATRGLGLEALEKLKQQARDQIEKLLGDLRAATAAAALRSST